MESAGNLNFSELDIRIKNSTSHDYSDVAIWIETNLGIEQLKPEESWFVCSSIPDIPPIPAPRVVHYRIDAQGLLHEEEGTTVISLNVPSWAYRVNCESLPHNMELHLIGALSNQNLEPNAPIGSPLYLPPKPARWVKMKVSYVFRHLRTVEDTHCFTGEFGRSMSVADCGDAEAKLSMFRTTPDRTVQRLIVERQNSSDFAMKVAVVIFAVLVFTCVPFVFVEPK
jgi:hypothetical protein